jgi:hypothetical protein
MVIYGRKCVDEHIHKVHDRRVNTSLTYCVVKKKEIIYP